MNEHDENQGEVGAEKSWLNVCQGNQVSRRRFLKKTSGASVAVLAASGSIGTAVASANGSSKTLECTADPINTWNDNHRNDPKKSYGSSPPHNTIYNPVPAVRTNGAVLSGHYIQINAVPRWAESKTPSRGDELNFSVAFTAKLYGPDGSTELSRFKKIGSAIVKLVGNEDKIIKVYKSGGDALDAVHKSGAAARPGQSLPSGHWTWEMAIRMDPAHGAEAGSSVAPKFECTASFVNHNSGESIAFEVASTVSWEFDIVNEL